MLKRQINNNESKSSLGNKVTCENEGLNITQHLKSEKLLEIKVLSNSGSNVTTQRPATQIKMNANNSIGTLSQFSNSTSSYQPNSTNSHNRHSLYENNKAKLTNNSKKGTFEIKDLNSQSSLQSETIYSSFSDCEHLQIPQSAIRIVSSNLYKGVMQTRPSTFQTPSNAASKLYKFPIVSTPSESSKEEIFHFSKCNSNIKDALGTLHNASPFKKGNLCQKSIISPQV